MNEADTRAELIDPKLAASGWNVWEDSKISRNYYITDGKIQPGGGPRQPLVADYILIYKGRKLAVIEAKRNEFEVGEGVAQAKHYAEKLCLDTCFSCNGKEIYQICMKTGVEGLVAHFPTPEDLWNKTFSTQNAWRDAFQKVPFKKIGNTKARYYQEIAVNNAMKAISEEKQRILLTLATGTGKTFIAFQIVWKLFQTRWNLKRDRSRQPRILFLADRNILADQAFNAFSSFPEDARVRISPKEMRKTGNVPTNGAIFFTIFQSFMSGKENQPSFGQYPCDYFDFIIIDECHRGGANNEGNWRGILEYFSPAVQLGLTATPKRKDNVDTYKYFGEPVYTYSLKEGINDGFLTPFKVKTIKTTLDSYIYTSDDQVIEGEVEEGRIYKEADFNKIIEIKEREAARIKIFLREINQNEKAIVFCATQDHAMAVRDLINQLKKSKEPNYCARVTANDGILGDQYLKDFRDNEKTIPTILTTSQKLSTGVDARNIRNIVLMRQINSMIEFKQIIGRGTRLFDGKAFFTIYDFVDAYHHFLDPEWDGEPLEPESISDPKMPSIIPVLEEPKESSYEKEPKIKVKIKLRHGKEREIDHMISTHYWSAEGKPVSVVELLQKLVDNQPEFFKSEEELRVIWSNPGTRKGFLQKLEEAGYGLDKLKQLQEVINAENSDLFDVLAYIASEFTVQPINREVRVARAQSDIFDSLNPEQKEFLEFVLSKYIETGVEELDTEKLPDLLTLKYHNVNDGVNILGSPDDIKFIFINFQQHLYKQRESCLRN